MIFLASIVFLMIEEMLDTDETTFQRQLDDFYNHQQENGNE